MRVLLVILLVSTLFGCVSLKIRNDKNKVKTESTLVLQLRQQIADLRAKNLKYEEQFRIGSGKIEELEIINRRFQESSQKRLGEESQQLQAYKDSVSELVAEKKKLDIEVLRLREENKKVRIAIVAARKTAKQHLNEGDKYFDDKKWFKAASEFQLYRDKVSSKKSESYALITYKIGVCFQELGMEKEAKTFYKSVVSNYKKFKAAKYAEYRLANLK